LSEPLTVLSRAPDRGAARRQAFLRAARQVFLEQGYEAACVNDVVRLGGGSLATLYAQFSNKEGLFLAVAQEQHEQMIAAMTPPCVDHMSLEDGLQAIGESFLRALLAPDNLAFFSIVVGEGRKFPHLLQRFIFASADRIRGVIVEHLERAAPDIANADQIASYFIELLRSRHHYRALAAGETYVLSDSDLVAHVQAAVRFFVRGARG
jgi:AcrR family transcriptional regulator